MSSARRRYKFDVFISYSHRNKDWVRGWLVPKLKDAGLKVCIDYKSFEPGAPSITEMERAVLQSRKTVLVLTPEYLQSEWAEFENIMVQTLDLPARQRRLLPIRLAPCEPPLRIGILTYIDFTRQEEQKAGTGRLIEAIRPQPTTARKRKAVVGVSLPPEVPTGALFPDSRFYIERNHDQVIRQHIISQGSTTVIEGARQMGKSSLLAQALAHARSNQFTVVDFDFQDFDEHYFSDAEILLRYLADYIYERLQPAASPDEVWARSLGAKHKLTFFIHDYVLQGAQMPVVLVMDEVDRVFGRPYQNDFFALLRAWHNKRAKEPLWRKLNLVLAYSTDPRQAIKESNQSPFNVGTKIQLDDFSPEEVWELNRRYHRPLKRKVQIKSVMHTIGGHPYLAQRALYALASQTHTLLNLMNTNKADIGPFADHLYHYRNLLESEPTLRQGMKQVIVNGRCPNYGVFSRLRSVGLITGISHKETEPRCRLYAEYFERVLS